MSGFSRTVERRVSGFPGLSDSEGSAQTPEVQAVRRNTYELVEFLHDVLQAREFPWAAFPHKVGLHIGCATLRGWTSST